MDHATIAKQPVAPPPAPPHPIEWAARDKSDATGNEKQATMSQMVDAARPHAPQP